jgi:hypothetical protein
VNPALFVPKRFGIGWTINFASPKALLFLLAIAGFVVLVRVGPVGRRERGYIVAHRLADDQPLPTEISDYLHATPQGFYVRRERPKLAAVDLRALDRGDTFLANVHAFGDFSLRQPEPLSHLGKPMRATHIHEVFGTRLHLSAITLIGKEFAKEALPVKAVRTAHGSCFSLR